MATDAYLIGIEESDGTIRAVHCTRPSPSTAHDILPRSYNSTEKIEALLRFGDLGTLRRNPPVEEEEASNVDLRKLEITSPRCYPHPDNPPVFHYFRNAQHYALEGSVLCTNAGYGFLWKDGSWQLTYFHNRPVEYHKIH